MKDCIKCGIICLAAGMIAGAIVVAKNKKLASVINDGTNKMAQTFADVKEDVEDKIEEIKDKANQMQQSEENKSNRKKN